MTGHTIYMPCLAAKNTIPYDKIFGNGRTCIKYLIIITQFASIQNMKLNKITTVYTTLNTRRPCIIL